MTITTAPIKISVIDKAGTDWFIAALRRRAAERPDAVAIADDDRTVTYGDLDKLTHEFAVNLHKQFETPSSGAFGFLGAAGVDLFLALIAAHKAAVPFVAFDSRWPNAEIHKYGQHANIYAFSGSDSERTRIRGLGFNAVEVPQSSTINIAPFSMPAKKDTVSHIRFTSGSTGAPKAVPVHRRHLAEMTSVFDRYMPPRKDDRYALFGQFWPLVMFRALSAGGRLDCFDFARKGAVSLREWVNARKITAMFAYPQLFRQLTEDEDSRFPTLRYVHLSGDHVSQSDIARFEKCCQQGAICHNNYGSTEFPWIAGHIHAHGDQSSRHSLPVGVPVFPESLQILDEDGKDSNEGEITIRHPWANDALLRTGDLARRDDGGVLHLIGRKGDRLKIRGNHIHPAEIETALKNHVGVKNCAVAGVDAANGEKQLICYLTPEGMPAPEPAQLRAYLEKHLPAYKIPDRFITVDELPLTASGKVQRTLLKTPPHRSIAARVAHTDNAMQHNLASIWAAILDREDINAAESFFDLGGDSLQAMTMLSAVERKFGVRIYPEEFAASSGDIKTLETLIQRAAGAREMITSLYAGDATGPALYAAHMIGGGHHMHSPFANAMAKHRKLLGVRSFKEERQSQHRMEDLAAMSVATLKKSTTEPADLIGYSFGALQAFEMARQMSAAGAPPRRLIMIDPTSEWTSPEAALRYFFAPLKKKQWLNAWRRLLLVGPLTIGVQRNSATLSERHIAASLRYRPGAFLHNHILLIVGANSIYRDGALRHWSKRLGPKATVIETPGDHFTMMEEPYVRQVADTVTQWLEATEAAGV